MRNYVTAKPSCCAKRQHLTKPTNQNRPTADPKDKTFTRDTIPSSVPKIVSRRLSQGRRSRREAVERSDILDAASVKLTIWHEGMETPKHQDCQTLLPDQQTLLITSAIGCCDGACAARSRSTQHDIFPCQRILTHLSVILREVAGSDETRKQKPPTTDPKRQNALGRR